jgi:hypothetical protein
VEAVVEKFRIRPALNDKPRDDLGLGALDYAASLTGSFFLIPLLAATWSTLCVRKHTPLQVSEVATFRIVCDK